jgi:peptide/nickel transport system substrate-binding protein
VLFRSGLFALACGPPAPASPARGLITLSVGLPQSRQIDQAHGASVLAGFLSNERLTGSGPDGRATPRLLEGWSVSPDGLTWRLVVRPDVEFQDGTLVTSDDVKRVLVDALANPAVRELSVALPDVIDVAAEGARDVVIRLRRRCAFLLDDLAIPVTRPGTGAQRVGAGPFAIESSSRDEIVMRANPRFYLGAPPIDRVVLRPYNTLRTAWAEMLRGRVDFLSDVSPDTVEFVQDQSAVRVHSYLSFYVYALVFNSNRPAFAKPEVKRALSLAIDREALLRQGLRGRGIPAYGPIWPRHWVADPTAPALLHDAERAAAMLDSAGKGAPGATRTARQSPRLRFTCILPMNFTIYERLGLLVQQQLWDINVDMRLESLPPDQYSERIESGRFDAAMMHIAGGPYLALLPRLWRSPDQFRRWNAWGYRDAAVDAAIDALRDAPDDEALREAARRLDIAQRENPPALFLAWNETAQSISRRFDVPTEPGRDALAGLSRARPRGQAEARR